MTISEPVFLAIVGVVVVVIAIVAIGYFANKLLDKVLARVFGREVPEDKGLSSETQR